MESHAYIFVFFFFLISAPIIPILETISAHPEPVFQESIMFPSVLLPNLLVVNTFW